MMEDVSEDGGVASKLKDLGVDAEALAE